MDDQRRAPGSPRRDELLANLARRGRVLPRWVVVAFLSLLVFMTIWGFVRSLT